MTLLDQILEIEVEYQNLLNKFKVPKNYNRYLDWSSLPENQLAKDEINAFLTSSNLYTLRDQLVEKNQAIPKGATVRILDKDSLTINIVTVKFRGKYKNDYSDFSNFYRVSDEKYSWYAPIDSIELA